MLILLIPLITCVAIAQRPQFISLRAFEYWDSTILCGNDLMTDKLGHMLYTSGCEGKCFVWLNRYQYKNDSLLMEPFDYLLEGFFVEVTKRQGNSKTQTITFLGEEGDTIKYVYDSANLIKLLGRLKPRWAWFNESLQIPRGKYRAIEICQLSQLFGVPAVFWLDKAFDYTLRLNVPSDIFRLYIRGAGNLPNKYLLMQNGKVYFPDDDYEMKIEELNGKRINY